MRIMYIGKRAPKGFREIGDHGIHLGKGMWLLSIEPVPGKKPNPKLKWLHAKSLTKNLA